MPLPRIRKSSFLELCKLTRGGKRSTAHISIVEDQKAKKGIHPSCLCLLSNPARTGSDTA